MNIATPALVMTIWSLQLAFNMAPFSCVILYFIGKSFSKFVNFGFSNEKSYFTLYHFVILHIGGFQLCNY